MRSTFSENITHLIQAFIHRVGSRDDSINYALAKELIEVATEEIGVLAAAGIAREIVKQVDPVKHAKAYKYLWGVVLEGWLAVDILPKKEREEENLYLGRFIAETPLIKLNTPVDPFLDQLRKGFDSLVPKTAKQRVISFLKLIDLDTDNDQRIATTVSKMLGRYLPVEQAIFLAHILEVMDEFELKYSGRWQSAAPLATKRVARILRDIY